MGLQQRDEDAGLCLPAPGDLKRVQGFVNSVDLEDGLDLLGNPEQLRTWLARHRLLDRDTPVSEADVRLVREVREALRQLLLANNEAQPDRDAIRTLNRIGSQALLTVRFGDDGRTMLVPDQAGAPGAIGRVLADVYTAMTEGSWSRLKACRNDTCRWAFYDYSKNHSGSWCTMAICGNRMKVRAYQQRRRSKS
ncbi:MAG: CGNR zinc finger domain-containing protein [Dehalococcoidia bacterium]